ncbi:IQ-DOMAIN 14-like protein [Tanacetum coccineum]
MRTPGRISTLKYDGSDEVMHAFMLRRRFQQSSVAPAHKGAGAVVRLASDSRGNLFSCREKWAATKIQSVYRSHLARRALRALRGLVKFQALVKGFVVRKRVNYTLYNMQTLLRAQMAVRFQRRGLIMAQEVKSIASESTSYDSIKNSYDESPKIDGMDPYRPHGQSRRNHYQDPERGFTGKDYKCSKTTQSTPHVAYSNRRNSPGIDLHGVAFDEVLEKLE